MRYFCRNQRRCIHKKSINSSVALEFLSPWGRQKFLIAKDYRASPVTGSGCKKCLTETVSVGHFCFSGETLPSLKGARSLKVFERWRKLRYELPPPKNFSFTPQAAHSNPLWLPPSGNNGAPEVHKTACCVWVPAGDTAHVQRHIPAGLSASSPAPD